MQDEIPRVMNTRADGQMDNHERWPKKRSIRRRQKLQGLVSKYKAIPKQAPKEIAEDVCKRAMG